MSEAVGIVVGSFVLAMAPVFVAAHYYREQMRRKRLGQLDHRHYWPHWSNALYCDALSGPRTQRLSGGETDGSRGIDN
ncbi:hypothetical protein PQQ96_02735 [Paraburkholderia sediminicola]|uniref:hypothetical protein n=1 Tax=Paraburkholderia sediminicola TaxID=458836 RepID=UPI0038B99BF2